MTKVYWSAVLADYLRDETSSYQSLAGKYGVSKQAVVERAKKEGWQDLRQKTRLKVNQKLTDIAAEEITEIRLVHAGYGRKLREKGMEAIESGKVPISTATEALRGVKEGISIEREALGMDQLPAVGTVKIVFGSKEIDEWAT